MKDHSVVAVLDLLGFTQALDSLGLDEMERKYVQSVQGAISFAGLGSMGAFLFDTRGNLEIGTQHWSIESHVFSDTVILVPRRFSEQPLSAICRTVALLIDMAMQADWLFRGGIDFGTFRALPKFSVYLGKGLVSAHRLETAQNWSGCIVGEGAKQRFPKQMETLLRTGQLVEYSVPVKTVSGVRVANHVAVNWCYYNLGRKGKRRRKLLTLLRVAPAEARPKIEATIAFHDEMRRRGLDSVESLSGPAFGDPTGGSLTSHAPDGAQRPRKRRG